MTTDTKHRLPGGIETLTNGEKAEISDKANFLSWMLEKSKPVPSSPDEYHAFMEAWIKYRRRNGIWA
jgi:hypothetical protein